MADERDAPVIGGNARRRCVGVGAWRAFGPKRPAALAPPAQLLAKRARCGSVQVEKPRAVEMIRHRPVIIARRSCADAEYARDRAKRGGSGEQAAAGEKGHGNL